MSSQWIAYPGEFEVYHNGRISLLRKERNSPYPPVWHMDGWFTSVHFSKQVTLEKPGTFRVFAEGVPLVRIDDVSCRDPYQPISLSAGTHIIEVLVGCLEAPPAVRVEGCIETDSSWTAFNGFYPLVPAAVLDVIDADTLPSKWHLTLTPWKIHAQAAVRGGLLVDVGKEAMGKLVFTPAADGTVRLNYGESLEEAIAGDEAEAYEFLPVKAGEETVMPEARAMRYCLISGVEVSHVSFLYESLPHEKAGRFACSNEKLNRIYETALYTMELCTREFFLDGIKRDRWPWAGDALQSVMINHYTFFDKAVARRTLRALRGKEPFLRHINTILDYTFYWFMSIGEDYLYTGDDSFIREIYPKMVSAMDFCLGRRNAEGFMEGLPDDWVFIDWADMPKDGELCAEQQLLARALEVMAMAARMMGDDRADEYARLAAETKKKLLDVFWDKEEGVLRHSRKDGVVLPLVTRYPAMFALQLDQLPEEDALAMARKVLLSDTVQKITTPYMHFYELDALCRIGLTKEVMEETERYWGGMLDAGATSFWEEFDPEETDHYAMYGRPFGRSLCHCWGAGPLYLFGRYLLGVVPTAPGYKTYTVSPDLAGLDWVEGEVPTPVGDISVHADSKTVTVTGCGGEGTVVVDGQSYVLAPYQTLTIQR